MHTHSDYATALGCMVSGLILPIHQNSLRYINRVAYHNDYDVPFEMQEGESLGKSLKDKDILIMAQHGMLWKYMEPKKYKH